MLKISSTVDVVMSPISGQSGPHSGKIADKNFTSEKEAGLTLKRPSEYTKAFKRRDYKFQIGAIGIFTSEKKKNSLEDAFSASNRERERQAVCFWQKIVRK